MAYEEWDQFPAVRSSAPDDEDERVIPAAAQPTAGRTNEWDAFPAVQQDQAAKPKNEWDAFPAVQQQQKPEAEGQITTAAREAAGVAPSTLGGLAVGASAAGFGRVAGATLGRVIGGLAGTWGGPAGNVAGWIGGGLAGGYIGEELANGIKKFLGYDDDAQRTANRETNPVAAAIGQVAPLALGLSPGRGIQAGARLLSGAIGGATEGAAELSQGEFSKERMAANILGGVLLPGNKQWLSNIESRAATRAGERPPVAPPGPKSSEWTGPPADTPEAPPPRPEELDLTGGRPGTSGGPQTEFDLGGREPTQQPAPPPRDTSTGQGQLPLEQQPEIGQHGQYELPIEPRTQREMFPEENLGKRERPGEAAPEQPSTAPSDQPELPMHGTPGAEAAAGTAEAKPPPTAAATSAHGPEDYGKKTTPSDGQTGVNVGDIDKTLAQAVKAKEPPVPPEQQAAAQQAGVMKDLEERGRAIIAGPAAEAPNGFREIAAEYRKMGQEGQAKKYDISADYLESILPKEPPPADIDARMREQGVPPRRPGEPLQTATPEEINARMREQGVPPRQEPPPAATAGTAEPAAPPPRNRGEALKAKQAEKAAVLKANKLAMKEGFEAKAAKRAEQAAADKTPANVAGDFKVVPNPDGPGHVITRNGEQLPEVYPTKGPAFVAMNKMAKELAQSPQEVTRRVNEAAAAGKAARYDAAMPYEITVKTGDKTTVARAETMQGARDHRAIEQEKNPDAIITIKKVKPQEQPIQREPIERGPSGRPTRTEPLPIGTEEAILEKGYERATGPKGEPQEPAIQPARRQQQQQEQPQQPIRPNTVRTHDGAVFTGDTVNEAAANARNAGYRPNQIFRPREAAAPPPGEAPPKGPTPPGEKPPPPERELPPDTGGPYAPPPKETRRLDAIRSLLEKVERRYKETFDPGRISPISERAEPLFRKGMTEGANEKDIAAQQTKEGLARWRKIPEEDRYKLISDIERGRPVDPKYIKDAPDLRRMLEETHDLEKNAGLRAAYREQYFPHEFELQKGQEPIQDFFTRTLGPNWFLKKRTIDLVEQAVKGGYRLKDSNPYAAVRSRMVAGAELRMQKGILDDLRGMGAAGIAGDNEKTNALLRKLGWQAINGPDGKQWLLHPDVQPLWKNAISDKGMWSDPGLMGDAFRTWMQYKAFTVPLKLAFSGFHALHMGHINFSTNMARSFSQMASGDMEGATRSMGQAFTTTFRPKAVIDGKTVLPHDIQEQWNMKPEDRHPDVNMAIGYLKEAGIVPHMSEQLRSDAETKLRQAVEDRNPFGVAFHLPREAIRRIQAPMFEHWIPRMKIAAALNDIGAVLERNPDYHINASDRRVALSAIGKSADDKFGEMFYDGLFWNKMLKDTSIGSMLSLGWNLGFARQFGGAAIEAVTRPAGKFIPALAPSAERKIIRDATNKIGFATTYMGTALAIGGLMTKAMSGENPQELNDYIFPKVGGVNPDGSPRRLTTMFYTRELPMLGKHIEEHGGGIGGMLQGVGAMVWNKTMFQPFLELMQNRNYFGSEIWNPHAPGYEQLMQGARHFIGNQILPMTYTGAQRAEETQGVDPKLYPTTAQGALAYLGFGPAPAYADKSSLQNEITHLYQQHVAPADRPYEDPDVSADKRRARDKLLLAIQSGDPAARQTAHKEALDAGMKPAQLAKLGKTYTDQNMFYRLPVEDQMAVLERATPEEHQRYWQYAKGPTRLKWNKDHPVRTQ